MILGLDIRFLGRKSHVSVKGIFVLGLWLFFCGCLWTGLCVGEFLGRSWGVELWAFDGARIAVRFAYECHDDSGNWFRSYGNENWEFDASGLMHHRYASINDLPIKESERKFHWPLGRRPDDHPGLSQLGL